MAFPRADLSTIFRARVAESPDAVAILGASSFTYAELDRASDAVARSLRDAGLTAGERMALYAVNSPRFAMAYLGIVKCGMTVVPINVLLGEDEIAFMLQDSGAVGLLYSEVLAVRAAAVAQRADGVRVLCQVESAADPAIETLDAWLSNTGPVFASPVADPDSAVAAIIYTSGTTGRPKGAMLSHRNLAANTWSTAQALHIKPGEDRLLVVLPLFHSFAATVGMLTTVLYGAAFIPLAKFDPMLVVDAIADYGATVFLGVPSMYGVLLRLPAGETGKLRSLRACVSGGAAMPVEMLRRFEQRFGVAVYEGDGPTECSPVTCLNPLDGVRKPGTVGLPVPLVDMAIRDAEGRAVADGELGEICVRGPNVMLGYLGLPAETEAAFFGEWLRTGDLGVRDADGYFSIVDRLKDMMIVNGMNVYPRMIEEVLYQLDGVKEAAVIGEPHSTHGEVPVAYVALTESSGIGEGMLRAHCKSRLGPHQLPRRFELLGELPKNATGKIMKRELRRHGELERGVDASRF